MNGSIARLVKERKFGFIKGEDKKEYFFHMSGLRNISFDDLEEGRDVIFEEVETKDGWRAEDIFV